MPLPAIPSQEEVTAAIEAANSQLISQYVLAIEFDRQKQAGRLPTLLDAAANAKRDLDICKAVIRNHDQTISLIQSVLRQLRP